MANRCELGKSLGDLGAAFSVLVVARFLPFAKDGTPAFEALLRDESPLNSTIPLTITWDHSA